MEENNRKGPGIFYAVVGVATLVVAIIGATFAYFSASATNSGDPITGSTVDLSSTDLEIAVQKINFSGAVADDSLVPAFFGTHIDTEVQVQQGQPPQLVLNVPTPADLGTGNIVNMISNSCVNGGYTGCHVYKITYTNNGENTISNANVWLTLSSDATDTTQWGYAVFKPTDNATGSVEASNVSDVEYVTVDSSSATEIFPFQQGQSLASLTKTSHDSIGQGFQRLDLHNNAALTTGSHVVYLMIYVNDDDASQNKEGQIAQGQEASNVIGNYSGNVSLDAMGGKVRASFGNGNLAAPGSGSFYQQPIIGGALF